MADYKQRIFSKPDVMVLLPSGTLFNKNSIASNDSINFINQVFLNVYVCNKIFIQQILSVEKSIKELPFQMVRLSKINLHFVVP